MLLLISAEVTAFWPRHILLPEVQSTAYFVTPCHLVNFRESVVVWLVSRWPRLFLLESSVSIKVIKFNKAMSPINWKSVWLFPSIGTSSMSDYYSKGLSSSKRTGNPLRPRLRSSLHRIYNFIILV